MSSSCICSINQLPQSLRFNLCNGFCFDNREIPSCSAQGSREWLNEMSYEEALGDHNAKDKMLPCVGLSFQTIGFHSHTSFSRWLWNKQDGIHTGEPIQDHRATKRRNLKYGLLTFKSYLFITIAQVKVSWTWGGICDAGPSKMTSSSSLAVLLAKMITGCHVLCHLLCHSPDCEFLGIWVFLSLAQLSHKSLLSWASIWKVNVPSCLKVTFCLVRTSRDAQVPVLSHGSPLSF